MNDIWKLTRILPDKLYLQIMYFKHFHKLINFENPVSFNEKLQWLKIYDRKPEYTTMVDKHLAKEYVAAKIGREYIIPTLGVWEKAEDIDFDALPDQFVLKCNNDSGGIVICKDKSKLNKEKAISLLSSRLNNNGFWYGREWPYKNVKPCILAEEYMEDTTTGELRDYKFFCFGGQVRCYKVDFDRFVEHHANCYDRESQLLEFGEASFPPLVGKKLELPRNIELMMELSEKLAGQTPFLRTDFYDVDGKVYFGEMTFYPASGFGQFTSHEAEIELGKWLKIPAGGVLVTKDWIILFEEKKHNDGLTDYKVHVFNGRPRFILVCKDRYGKNGMTETFFTDHWEKMNMRRTNQSDSLEMIPKPAELEQMLRLATVLAGNIPFLRVDFYVVNHKLYFGELTFYPASGFKAFEPEIWDRQLGNYLTL